MIGRLSTAVVLLTLPLAVPAAAPPAEVQPVEVRREAYLMGTRASLQTWAIDRGEGLSRLERALTALERTEAELSTWRDDSAVSALNRSEAGVAWQAAPSLCRLLVSARDWHAATAGAFDPAIGLLTAAWAVHEQGRVPGDDEIRRALEASGFRHLEIDAACRVTKRTAVRLDVGAFGKGEALDRARDELGERPWMIDLGGQIAAGAPPPGRAGWPIAVADPADRFKPALHLSIGDGSLATSAGSERDHRVDGRRVGHILDPRTGHPAAFDGSVSVWHESALVADILSTALYVMGPAEGLAWAEARGVAACFLERVPGGAPRAAATAAFRASVIFSGETFSFHTHEEN